MKLRDLAPVLFSRPGSFQSAVVYDIDKNADLMCGGSVDYALKEFGDRVLARITAEGDSIVLQVIGKENDHAP